MINPRNFELADTAPFAETTQAAEALKEALSAMAHHGSDIEHMNIIATLHCAMMKEVADSYRADMATRKVEHHATEGASQ